MISLLKRSGFIYACILGVIGVFLSTFFGAAILQEGLSELIVFLPFFVISIALVIISVFLLFKWEKEEVMRIFSWGFGAGIFFMAVSALIGFHLDVFFIRSVFRVVLMGFGSGCLAGVLVGVYDVRSRRHRSELKEKKERVEDFAEKAADINNYGKLLNEASSLDEISSLTLEAIGVDEVEVIESVSLEKLSKEVVEEVLSVMERDEGAEVHDVNEFDFWIISPIHGTDKCLVVKPSDVSEFEKEDVKLLGILSNHVMTSLEHLEHK